jgi:hypothetical protein
MGMERLEGDGERWEEKEGEEENRREEEKLDIKQLQQAGPSKTGSFWLERGRERANIHLVGPSDCAVHTRPPPSREHGTGKCTWNVRYLSIILIRMSGETG